MIFFGLRGDYLHSAFANGGFQPDTLATFPSFTVVPPVARATSFRTNFPLGETTIFFSLEAALLLPLLFSL